MGTITDLSLPIQLTELQQILKEHGVTRAYLFGSYARNEAHSNSDLDLLVKLAPDRTYFDLGKLQYELELKLGIKVDITTKLNHRFAPYIEPNLVEIL